MITKRILIIRVYCRWRMVQSLVEQTQCFFELLVFQSCLLLGFQDHQIHYAMDPYLLLHHLCHQLFKHHWHLRYINIMLKHPWIVRRKQSTIIKIDNNAMSHLLENWKMECHACEDCLGNLQPSAKAKIRIQRKVKLILVFIVQPVWYQIINKQHYIQHVND